MTADFFYIGNLGQTLLFRYLLSVADVDAVGDILIVRNLPASKVVDVMISIARG